VKNFRETKDFEEIDRRHDTQSAYPEDFEHYSDFREAVLKEADKYPALRIDGGIFVNRSGQFYADLIDKNGKPQIGFLAESA